MSPDASFTISPGTTSEISTSIRISLRITSMRLLIIFCSFCAALLDFSVCTKEMIPEMRITATSIRKVDQLGFSAMITSVTRVIPATPSSTTLKGLMIASLTRSSRLFSLPESIMFFPYSSRRALASTWLIPSRSVSRRAKISSSERRLSSTSFFST